MATLVKIHRLGRIVTTLSRTWPACTLATDDGAMLILQSSSGEFYIAGSGLTVSSHAIPMWL